MANSSDAYSPQRHATRAPVERRVRLQFEKSQAVTEGECRNISIGGMFVVGACAGAAGETARFELGLEDGSAIRGLADVMWIRATDGGPGKEMGFGLKFKFLEQRDRQLIFKLVSRHIKDRLASRHPAPVQEVSPSAGDMVIPPVVARPPVPQPAAPQPAAPQPAAPQPAASDHALPGGMKERSIFDSGEGLDSPSEQDLQSEGSELPDDWDSDPTAFDIPKADIPKADIPKADIPKVTGHEPSPSVGHQPGELSFAGVEAAPESPLAPPPLESEVDSLSNVFMKDQDFALDLPLDPKMADEPELPLVTPMPSDAASDPYLQHLGEDHFDHRPAPKRDLPILPIASLVLVLAAALGYLFSDQLFEWASADGQAQVTPPPTEAPATQSAAPGSVYQAPGSSKVDESPAKATPTQADPGESQSKPSPGSSPPPRQSASPSRAPAETPPPKAADPEPRQTSPPTASRPAGGKAFKSLSDVTWRAEGQGLLLTITVDGAASSARVNHFRLDGESPREVVRLLGVDRRASLSTLQVGVGGVRQIRFGWHKKRRGNEIHLVMDMADRQSRVLSVKPEGNRFLVRIGR